MGERGAILHWDGSCWSEMESGTEQNLYAVCACSPASVFASGDGLVLHYDGKGWKKAVGSIGLGSMLVDMWRSPARDIFILATSGNVVRWDKTGWNESDSGRATRPICGICGRSNDDLYVAGYGGIVRHWDGKAWEVFDWKIRDWQPMTESTRMPDWSEKGDFSAIWASSVWHLFAVGRGGVIVQWDRGRCWRAESATEEELRSVWGSACWDVFAVGAKGTIVHWDGKTWSKMESPTSEDLNAVWGSINHATSARDVFAVGDRGTILHYSSLR